MAHTHRFDVIPANNAPTRTITKNMRTALKSTGANLSLVHGLCRPRLRVRADCETVYLSVMSKTMPKEAPRLTVLRLNRSNEDSGTRHAVQLSLI
jgi:hypothetical protein